MLTFDLVSSHAYPILMFHENQAQVAWQLEQYGGTHQLKVNDIYSQTHYGQWLHCNIKVYELCN